jgi:hypothetical protein
MRSEPLSCEHADSPDHDWTRDQHLCELDWPGSAGTAAVSPAEYSALVPSIKQGRKIGSVRNIDIAPTVMEILGVAPAPTVDGAVIPKLLRKDRTSGG